MDEKIKSRLNYILGRFEGIAFATTGEIQIALLDTCEMLLALLEEE